MSSRLIGLSVAVASIIVAGCEGKTDKPEPAGTGTPGELKLPNLFSQKPGNGGDLANPPRVPDPAGVKDPPAPAAAKVFQSPQELVAGLPADARPRSHDDQVRIDRANDWLKANIVGKRFEWDHYFDIIRMERLPGGSKYRISLNVNFLNEENHSKYTHTLHGQKWWVMLSANPVNFIGGLPLGEVDASVADRISGRANKFLKVNAGILRAEFRGAFGGGFLQIAVTDYIVEGFSPTRSKRAEVTKAVPSALKNLKSPDPAVRAEAARILACAPAEGKAALTDLIDMVGEKDEAVREAAISAITAIDPRHKAVADLIPAGASVDGKYAKLLIRLHAPNDKPEYGDFRDYGAYPSAAEAYGFKVLPAGHWVYVAPNWYIWGEMKK